MAESPSELRAEIEKLERKHAENPEGRYFVPLANDYRKLGDLERAESLLRAGLEKHPDYLSARIVLGRCLADRNASEEAAHEFDQVLSMDPQNLIALRSLAELALADDRREDAERWYRELLAVDPMNDEARRALERISVAAGETGAPDAEEGSWWDPDAIEAAEEKPARDTASADVAAAGTSTPAREEPPPRELVDELDDWEIPDDVESVEVVTETIAELYARQGLHERAADVYRELIRRRGGDESLEKRLAELEREAEAARQPSPDAGGPGETAPTGGISAPWLADEGAAGAADELETGAEEGSESAEALRLESYSGEPLEGFQSLELEEPTPGAADAAESLELDPYGRAEPEGVAPLEPDSHTGESLAVDAGAEQAPPAAQAAPTPDELAVADPFAASFQHGFSAQAGDEPTPASVEAPGAEADREPEHAGDPGEARLQPESGTIAGYLASLAAWTPGASRSETADGAEVEGPLAHRPGDLTADAVASVGIPGASEPTGGDEPSPGGDLEGPMPWETPAAAGEIREEPAPDLVFPETSTETEPRKESEPGAYGWELEAGSAHDDRPEAAPAAEPGPAPDAGEPVVELDDYFPETPSAEQRGSTPPPAEDDDDLESFQAWLRSLKR